MLRRHALYPSELRAPRRSRSPFGPLGQGRRGGRNGTAPAAGRATGADGRARGLSRVLSPGDRAPGEDHSSGAAVAGDLVRPTRDSGGAGHPSSPTWPCSGWGLPCDPCCQGPGALLPHPFTLACAASRRSSAVCSLWHFPSPHGARALPGTLPCGARTFLRSPWRRSGDPHSRARTLLPLSPLGVRSSVARPGSPGSWLRR
jgi:hypothetical protein